MAEAESEDKKRIAELEELVRELKEQLETEKRKHLGGGGQGQHHDHVSKEMANCQLGEDPPRIEVDNVDNSVEESGSSIVGLNPAEINGELEKQEREEKNGEENATCETRPRETNDKIE